MAALRMRGAKGRFRRAWWAARAGGFARCTVAGRLVGTEGNGVGGVEQTVFAVSIRQPENGISIFRLPLFVVRISIFRLPFYPQKAA